jgi:hypothetical protein
MMRGKEAALCRAASIVRDLARHERGRSALAAAGAEAALAAAAGLGQGAWAPALAEALGMLRRPPEHASGPAPRLCTVCGAQGSSARPLKQCGGCRGPERWCSAECQRSGWAGHRAVCLERRAAAAEAAGPAGPQRAV